MEKSKYRWLVIPFPLGIYGYGMQHHESSMHQQHLAECYWGGTLPWQQRVCDTSDRRWVVQGFGVVKTLQQPRSVSSDFRPHRERLHYFKDRLRKHGKCIFICALIHSPASLFRSNRRKKSEAPGPYTFKSEGDLRSWTYKKKCKLVRSQLPPTPVWNVSTLKKTIAWMLSTDYK